MPSEQDVRLRPARAQDRFLIRRWLSDPAVASCWGTPASAEAKITLALDSAAALPRVIERTGIPIGYAHAVEHGLWSARPPEGLPAGAWDVDYFLAPPATGDSQLGSPALILLTQEVFTTTLAVACSTIVAITNEGAVRAYERAGFRWQRVLADPLLGRAWLMLLERPALQQVR